MDSVVIGVPPFGEGPCNKATLENRGRLALHQTSYFPQEVEPESGGKKIGAWVSRKNINIDVHGQIQLWQLPAETPAHFFITFRRELCQTAPRREKAAPKLIKDKHVSSVYLTG